jgi:hypothetical protein
VKVTEFKVNDGAGVTEVIGINSKIDLESTTMFVKDTFVKTLLPTSSKKKLYKKY